MRLKDEKKVGRMLSGELNLVTKKKKKRGEKDEVLGACSAPFLEIRSDI